MSARDYDSTAATQAEREWDWESRQSAYSTVADPADDSYCEACDQAVIYDGSKHGRCGCS